MPGWELKTVEDAKRIFNEQLKKCQVDYFDFYLCHALSKNNFEIYKKNRNRGFSSSNEKRRENQTSWFFIS